jgi:alpha-aminoadipate/glutamate carrier protein LysW
LQTSKTCKHNRHQKNLSGGFYFLTHTYKENTMIQANTVSCPVCEADVHMPADVMENELISCQDCGTELEIISLNPLEVVLAPETEEDWGE